MTCVKMIDSYDLALLCSLLGRQASIELLVRLVTSDGVLMWLGSQSSWLPLMTLDVVNGHLLLTCYSHNDVTLTAWNAERIDDNTWHMIRVHRYVDTFLPVAPRP